MVPHVQTLYTFADGLRQRAREAAQAARLADATDADRARAFALFEAVGLLLREAEAAGLDPASVGLGGFNPDLDLLGPTS
jgi:hypothetical protein